jgi:hypothetical protein
LGQKPLNEAANEDDFSFAFEPETAKVSPIAGLAQLVEHELPKLEVVGSNPMSRSEE